MPDQTTQDISVKVLLPALTPDHQFNKPKNAGRWHGVSSNELVGISNGLDAKPAKLQVNSIPDVWARLLLFESALFNEAHKLHNTILGEWRGLLALIALKEIKNLSLFSVSSISLNSEIKENNEVWHSSLSDLIPPTQVFNNTTWANLFLFVIDKKPVGITSPTTLVATSTDYSGLTLSRSQISWYDGERLKDPTQSDLSQADKQSLASWLNNLHEQLKNESPLDKDRLNSLLKLIEDYRDSLYKSPEKATLSHHGFGISGINAGVFTFLDKPVASLMNTHCNVQLIHSKEKSPLLPIYLVDTDIAEKWKKQPSQVSVYGAYTLASIPYEGLMPNVHNKLGIHDITTAEIWSPQVLFNENLYYVNTEKAFPGTVREKWHQNQIPKIQNQDISLILPLNPKLLEHYTSADLLERIVFTQETSGDITVNLTVHLSGFDENTPLPYVITKKYTRDKMFDFTQVPILEVFPNFVSNNWKAYYVAYSSDNLSATFQATPYPSNPPEINIPLHQNAKRCVWKNESFPEAFICSHKGKGELATKEIGLLLLESPQSIDNPNREFTVGVDFGASGTMLYYSDGKSPQTLDFNQSRKLSVTKKSDAQKADVLKFFLPETDIHPAFLTLYQDFNNQDEKHQSFLNGHIYYLSGVSRGSVTDLMDKNVYSNLKWSEEFKTNFFVKSLLAQICLQSSAELVAQGASIINWKFSFPTAFDRHQTSNFKAIWQEIVKTTSNLTGLPFIAPKELSESIAAAECFRNGGAFLDEHKVSTEAGVIFIDIGGSTSDISIYQNNNLLSQFSLRFAGRDLFLQYLRKNSNVLTDVGINISNLNVNSDIEKFWAQIDSILKLESDKIFQDLPLHSGKESVKALKKYLAVGLSGLFYYLGLVVNQLVEKEQSYNGLFPHIYIAGNGSQMFHWLTNKMPIDEHPIKELFEKVFLTAVGSQLNGIFNLKITERPKHEAAYGLVCENTLNTSIEEKPVIAGESFVSNNNHFKWDEFLTEEVLETNLAKPTQFEQLPKFIDAFNIFVKRDKSISPIVFDATTEDSIVRNLTTLLAKSNRDEQKIIFILALKTLLDTLD